ncbi:MAG: bifunctional alpha,alpha-trehalose-phosphate synthase (UDP-forming)/trehalose-phosphatase [Ignavibacteriae bacterium]|nr:bifunctional alpha,alpha-trehalose-phosphate synthase (UDP-forming)/trehalose-phosphatase [Ignavibacteriota bacterium]
MPVSKHHRLVIVSNRLPFSAKVENGSLHFGAVSGGLATGLSSFLGSYKEHFPKQQNHLWVGWPGATIDEQYHNQLRKQALEKHNAYPVFLSEHDMENFYQGFCNSTIWPLFHYFPSSTIYNDDYWDQYVKVNELFADTLAGILGKGDVVWMQDYHLMLLPHLLRKRQPRAEIGFFLHIPFPSFEMFRLLPLRWRRAILEGLLGADLIGFHTHEYTHHFLQSVLRTLGHDHSMGQISLPNRVVKADTFPMGIDYKRFVDACSAKETEDEKLKLKQALGDAKTILSVDRLDYSKGILHRLLGYEALLENYPQLRGKVVLTMVVVPSRIGVNEYEHMKNQVEEAVGRINGKFGSVVWTPVIYQFKALAHHPLIALYSIADVALVTPLRDGMNLIAKEYVACRTEGTGVLILSEMAGAAKELGEAIIINPNDRREIADALSEALAMPKDEQVRRNTIMRDRLRRYDVTRWASDFLTGLNATKEVQERLNAKLLDSNALAALRTAYRKAANRLIFLDYDGTLTPLMRHPDLASPSQDTLSLLRTLTRDPKNTVIIISGRNRATLSAWLDGIPIGLVAEHGIWRKEKGGEWESLGHGASNWKEQLFPIIEQYADRLPGALVEEKEYSLVWHYRMANPDQAQLLAAELTDRLLSFAANNDVQVLRGNKVIEVRPAAVNKGVAARHWLVRGVSDFVLAIGDDWTDEDMFAALPEDAFSIRVGVTNTRARYNVKDVNEVAELLSGLAG